MPREGTIGDLTHFTSHYTQEHTIAGGVTYFTTRFTQEYTTAGGITHHAQRHTTGDVIYHAAGATSTSRGEV